MTWKQAHWADKILLAGILLAISQNTGGVVGFALTPVPFLVAAGIAFLGAFTVYIAKRPKFSVKPEPFWVIAASFAIIGVASSFVKGNSIIDEDLENAALALFLVPVVCYLWSEGLVPLFQDLFAGMMAAFGVGAVILGLIKLQIDLGGGHAPFVAQSIMYPLGPSLVSDYNMSSLVVLLGVTGIFFLSQRIHQSWLRIGLQAVGFLMLLPPLLSQSRRYLLTLVATIVVFAIYTAFRKPRENQNATLIWTARVIIGSGITAALVIASIIIFGNTEDLPVEGPVGSIVNSTISRYRTVGAQDAVAQSRGRQFEIGMSLLAAESPTQVVFGRGFDYLQRIGDGPDDLDYPHSPLLSALLYGGIPALLLVCLLVIRPALAYWKHRNDLPFFAVTYAYLLIFLLVSNNSWASSLLLPVIGLIIYTRPTERNNARTFTEPAGILPAPSTFRHGTTD